jgi:hypothetical protein
MQSKVIQLPFENSASGYDLFSDGATALVPELTGYSGVDVIKPAAHTQSAGTAAAPAVTTPAVSTPAPPSPGLTVTSTVATNSGIQSVSVVGGSGSIGDVFVFGKYISLLDTKVIAGGRSAAFEILSREVIHVQIPANVIPTTIQDVEGDTTYVEVYLSTPNGISNSILIPYEGAPAAPKVHGYDVAAASQSIDVFYQWLTGADQKPTLVASAAPSATEIDINWDSDTGLGPRQIQVQFIAIVSGQNLILTLPATAGTKGDYSVDGPTFIATLFKRLQEFETAGTVLPQSIPFHVRVQPWLPTDNQGMRVRTEPKALKSKVTVNLYFNATGVNALPDAQPSVFFNPVPPLSGNSAQQLRTADSSNTEELPGFHGDRDPAIRRVAQDVKSLPSFLNTPQRPPSLQMPPLLAPNMTSEAEQVARMLTGQPLPASTASPNPTSAIAGTNQTTAATPNIAALATTLASQSAAAQAPNILVNPSPVIVVAHPPTDTKKKQQHQSRLHKMMNSLSNRISQALPDR